MKQLVLDIALPAAPTLDNFVPGRNAELVVALYALANGASNERFFYLWGADGSGRSHLLRAAAAAARRNGRRTVWFDAQTKVIDAADDVLCAADDVHLLGAEAQIALFNLHNRIRGGNGALLASGNAAPAQLRLRADLVTRLAAGLVYQLHGLGDEEKSAALRRHADARGLRLAPEVTAYLLRHARRDMPSLLALLDALDRYSLETKRAITVPLLRELLEATTKTS
ncbi:MAG: DnaA regulatory inactivator Hda [Betaproteobacteria bacterium]|nr:DnaA regulatory inactivator Hda [Betaproteobacteria bacterium]